MSPLEGTLELTWFFSDETHLAPTAFVPIFHEWIREDRLPGEILIDVADYSHVRDGPGVVLAGHRSSFGVELVSGRLGLACRFGRDGGRSRLERAFQRSLRACRTLQETTRPPIRFRTEEVRLRILDRLRAPRNEVTWNAVVRELEPFLRRSLGEGASIQMREIPGDRAAPFGLTVDVAPAVALAHLT